MCKKINFVYWCLKKQKVGDFLKKKQYSDNNIFHLIKHGNIICNNIPIRDKNIKINPFSKLHVTLNDEECSLLPYVDKIRIIYEDNYVLVVDKPAGMDVQPTRANYEDNLSSRVYNYYLQNNIKANIHIINRLDKLTSGVVIFAKNQYIHHLFQKTKIKKYYSAIVIGNPPKKGLIKIKLKKETGSMKRIIADDGKACLTKFKRIKQNNNTAFVKIRLLTGRTHQIRVSFASIGCPLYGDPLYNSKVKENEKMQLRCYLVRFKHPITKKIMALSGVRK